MAALTQDTKVTIGVVFIALSGAVTGTWWLGAQIAQLNNRLDRLDSLIGDRFSMTQASETALRLAMENPGMRVPDPRDPSQVIEVRPIEQRSK